MGWLPLPVQNRMIVLLIAALTDLAIGDPQRLWHPVQGIGSVISASEKMLRTAFKVPEEALEVPENVAKTQEGTNPDGTTPDKRRRERLAGALLVLIVLAVSMGCAIAVLTLCGRVHPFLRTAAEGILCGRLLALRSLAEAGYSVRDPLLEGRTGEARRAVSMIVGRDTDRLSAEGIAKAAVETVAENTSDGVTAPLFYMILFGGLGGVFYKAVNTMDSMVGYKNAKYRHFGTAAAKLDDVINFVPSRLTALLMILACAISLKEALVFPDAGGVPGLPDASGAMGLSGLAGALIIPDPVGALRIWRRDRRKSPSPNSAQTESVVAGALHIKLLGDTWYFGKLHHKEEIGDGERTVEPEDITRTVRLMVITSSVLFAAGLAVLAAIAFF